MANDGWLLVDSAGRQSCRAHGREACVPCCVDVRATNAIRCGGAGKPQRGMSRRAALDWLTGAGQPFELTTTADGLPAFVNGPRTLSELFASTRCSAPFLVYDGDDEPLSYEAAWRQAKRLARWLRQRGVAKGDRVAVSMRNYPEWIVSLMAATSVGAVCCALNSLWSAAELRHALAETGARVLFADDERLQLLFDADEAPPPSLLVVAVRPVHARAPSHQLQHYTDLFSDEEDDDVISSLTTGDDDALMLFTSGSTGFPKGAVSTHRAVLSALLNWELEAQAYALEHCWAAPYSSTQPAMLLGVPLFHVTGLHACLLAGYRQSRKLVLMYKWHADTAVALIDRHAVTALTATPAMTGELLRRLGPVGRAATLKQLGGGGAHRAPEQVRAIAQRGLLPHTGWGMTETNALGLGIFFVDYLRHAASSGRPSALVRLRLVDTDTGAVVDRPLQRGELQLRGVSLMKGYWQRPDATAAATTADGWLRTGDVAYCDADGFYYIVDRIKDLVIRGGENIGVGQVENALLEHPDVLECSVYSLPDDKLGEEVGATVYTNSTPLQPAQLVDFLKPRLARFEIPRYIRIVDQPLIRIASGKIDKRRIRQQHIDTLITLHSCL